jgi:EPS-associated MarR family transcriptional regulator
MLDDVTRYRLLHLLETNPELSQRELADEIGFSLGKTNYCVKALIDKGWVKARRFRNSRNKIAYLYQLTPTGVAEKIRVTRRFLAQKIREHEVMTAEIERLKQEVTRNDEQDAERLP